MEHTKKSPAAHRKRNYPRRRKQSKAHIPGIRPGMDPKLGPVFKNIGIPEAVPFVPDPFQIEAVEVVGDSDCLVTAPTGAGKTWIAVKAIEKIRETAGRAWYASPLKALTNAKFREFTDIFGTGYIGILTGDRKENPEAPITVGTTEILRNQLYDAMHEGRDMDTDLVILDEAHFLGDPDRGVVWEEILIYLPTRVPILMLSATVGNARQIAAWLYAVRRRECIVVEETKRPVPLFPIFFHPTGTLYPLLSENGGKGKKRLHKTVREYVNNKNAPVLYRGRNLPPMGDILQVLKKYNLLPAIFFCKSRADCDQSLTLSDRHVYGDSARKARLKSRIGELTAGNEHLADHRQLFALENIGVAAHHSGQLPAWKLLIETLMTEGLLDAVFATSTVAAGVNFPARTILMLNSDRYNGREFIPLNATEFHQMTGRAGRRGMDNIGFAVAIPGKYMDIPLVSRLVGAKPSSVHSQIRINFSMVLNLLLSHTPSQVEELLKKSFAAFQLTRKKKGKESGGKDGHRLLLREFERHLKFLKETGYVDENNRLTDDGIWASQLRVDQPLLIAEGFRRGSFPETDAALLAAIIAAFVNEQETDDRIEEGGVALSLMKALQDVWKDLRPFVRKMAKRGFETRSLYLRPAATIHNWATGLPWKKTVEMSEIAEGNLCMLILRTADHLRHIRALHKVFPQAAQTAATAIDLILKEPVSTYYEL